MSRGGRTKERSTPERRCIATGEVRPKEEMIRFVVGPDRQLVPDLKGKLPGRGIWVSPTRAALEKAASKGLFARAAKGPVLVPDNLAEQLEAAQADRVINLISLARKAGQAVAGYEKVRGWLATGQARLLLQASDGSPRGKSKLRPPGDADTLVEALTAQELGLAFGRENVIHGALAAGGLTERVVNEAAKLQGLRGKSGGTDRRKGTKTR